MNSAPLISAEELAVILDQCVVVDCRHELTNPHAGAAAYALGHIPGAHFLDQDGDLAGPKNGRNGRHPLPEREALATRLQGLGLSRGRTLVAYDGMNGMFAARLWWLARWLGHEQVAVLDGGLQAWANAGFPVSSEVPPRVPGDFTCGAASMPAVTAAEVEANLRAPAFVVLDARAPERYRGETEPIDPVAGHIPGAMNRFMGTNLRPDGRFKPAPVLRAEFDLLLAGRSPAGFVHQCGSGVTACHNLLAMEAAGLAGGALYAGSWSEWCSDPSRPVATGPNP